MSFTFINSGSESPQGLHRYHPQFQEKISKLPYYNPSDIKELKSIASEQQWSVTEYAGNYASTESPPLYSSNSFYEYLDECLIPNIVEFLLKDIGEMPVHINDEEPWRRSLSLWRLKIGK